MPISIEGSLTGQSLIWSGIYTDNFYSSPALFEELKSLGFDACGTVRLNRIGLTKTFKIKDRLLKGKN